MPDGGQIRYGRVEGANSLGAALAATLDAIHKECGRTPDTGSPFRFRGTQSAGLFFVTANCKTIGGANAGLIVAAKAENQSFDAALIVDSPGHLETSIDPMLARLFRAWHPAGLDPPVPLKPVALKDDTASVALPDGWQLAPELTDGRVFVSGPDRERIAIDIFIPAINPRDPYVRKQGVEATLKALGGKAIVLPIDADLEKTLPDLFQQIRHLNGLAPNTFTIEKTEPAAYRALRCVHATGVVDPDGKGDCDTELFLCAATKSALGMYSIFVTQSLLPRELADKEGGIAKAILASFQVNRPVIDAKTQIEEHIPERSMGDEARREAQRMRWADEDARVSDQWFGRFLLESGVIRQIQSAPGSAGWLRAAEFWKTAYPYRLEESPDLSLTDSLNPVLPPVEWLRPDSHGQ
jgi:hypothetical protein